MNIRDVYLLVGRLGSSKMANVFTSGKTGIAIFIFLVRGALMIMRGAYFFKKIKIKITAFQFGTLSRVGA